MSFRIRFWPSFFTAIGLALLVSLGTWQLNRFLDARTFEDQRDARMDLSVVGLESTNQLTDGELHFRRIEVEGIWDEELLFLIKHRVYEGMPGYWVVSPFVPTGDESSTALLVNRGWISIEDGLEQARHILDETPTSAETITGLVHRLDDVVVDDDFHERFDESSPPTGVVELESYDTTAMHRTVQDPGLDRPIVLTLGPDSSPNESEPIPSFDYITEPYLTAETHFGYMLTWYLLALALLAIWVAHGLGLLASPAYEERGERSRR